MLFNSIFVSSFLLASTVLARPRYYHDREEPHSQLFPRVEQDHDVASNRVQKTTLWAGAVLTENAVGLQSPSSSYLVWSNSVLLRQGTFVSVSGKFKVHHPSGTNGSSATAWVGIDGYGTQSVLHAGVAFLPDGKGGASYQGKELSSRVSTANLIPLFDMYSLVRVVSRRCVQLSRHLYLYWR